MPNFRPIVSLLLFAGVFLAEPKESLPGIPIVESPDCPTEHTVMPGRWAVESTRVGEDTAPGRSDIFLLEEGCILLERLVVHFEDGTSHHVVFIQGWDAEAERRHLIQIGDHPLFLEWMEEDGADESYAESYATVRVTDRGPISLRWTVHPEDEGFRRILWVRRGEQSGWERSEEMVYRRLEVAEDPAGLPSLDPGPFHDPDACHTAEFREMDYLLGYWLNEEWTRSDDGSWRVGTTSEVSVRPLIGGCALMETHPIYDEGIITDRLLLVRAFDTSASTWRQVVLGHSGGVWKWAVEKSGTGWILTPVGGPMEDRLRIHEHAMDEGLTKRIETRDENGDWKVSRLIRYVPW